MGDGWEVDERTVKEAQGHNGAVKTKFRSQENFQKLEIKIQQMVKADTAKLMPKSIWK